MLSGDQAIVEHSKELEMGNEFDELLKLAGSMRLAPWDVMIASIDPTQLV